MKKDELLSAIAENADISKAAASRALEATLDAIQEALSKGEDVTLLGFGTFKVSERAARTGRNPQTGETIQIAASKSASFKQGKKLKDAINK